MHNRLNTSTRITWNTRTDEVEVFHSGCVLFADLAERAVLDDRGGTN